MWVEILIILALVIANGVFAGAEIAVVALRKMRIEELADKGSRRARAVLALRNQPERFLATVQVGITVVSATAAAFGGAALAAELAPSLTGLPWVGEHADGVALALVIAAVSFSSIVIGELVPKSLALRGAERYALLIGRPLLGLSWLARPLVWLLSSTANVLLKPFGDSTTFTETRHSAEELQHMVEEAAKAGTIHPEAGEIASRALDLPELTCADVMVPRQNVVLIPRTATREQLRQTVLGNAHARIPVYDGQVDNVVGYLNTRDLLERALENEALEVDGIMRPPFFTPESRGAVDLLREMRHRHVPFAIVVDEHGALAGIVTMEDLLEELVGDIFSEHVENVPAMIEEEAGGSALVQGAAPVREINRALNLELPDEGAYTTVAGLCLAELGRMPSPGDLLEVPGATIEIIDASPRRIRAVRIRAKEAASSLEP